MTSICSLLTPEALRPWTTTGEPETSLLHNIENVCFPTGRFFGEAKYGFPTLLGISLKSSRTVVSIFAKQSE